MRRASRFRETARPVPAPNTTTPTGEVSISASRSARARSTAVCVRAFAIAVAACDANSTRISSSSSPNASPSSLSAIKKLPRCSRTALRRRTRLRPRRPDALVSVRRLRRHRPETLRPQAQLRHDARRWPRVRTKADCRPRARGRPPPPRGVALLESGALPSEHATDPGCRARSLPGRRLHEHRPGGVRPCRRR